MHRTFLIFCLVLNAILISSQARALSQSLKKQAEATIKQVDYLPFQFLDDGCYGRAYYLAAELAAKGIPSSLQYVFPKEGHFHPRVGIEWNFHVAVMDWYEGDLEPTLYDPSLSAKPLSRSEWHRALHVGKELKNYWAKGNEYGAGTYLYQNVGPTTPKVLPQTLTAAGTFNRHDMLDACREMHLGINNEPELDDKQREGKVTRLVQRSYELVKALRQMKVWKQGSEDLEGFAECN